MLLKHKSLICRIAWCSDWKSHQCVCLPSGSDYEMPMNMLKKRPVLDSDADDLFRLIEHCYTGYQGVFVERDGIDADLNNYASELAQLGGRGLVIGNAAGVIALVSGAPVNSERYQLKKLYVHEEQRGSGLAKELVADVETWATQHGSKTLELWSDTRFKRAHRFYEREGFVRQADTRALNDLSNSIEYKFVKRLQGSVAT